MKKSGDKNRMKTRMTVASIITLFLVGMLTMAFSPVATAHTEESPFVTDLIAGQTTDVGDVLVWNDGDCLYVKFAITDGWCMKKTYVHVATSLDGIPHTKKGSPIPGKFDYKEEHDCSITEYTHEIDLGSWTLGTGLFIAAHSDVCTPGAGGEWRFVQGMLVTVPMLVWASAENAGTITASIDGSNLVVTYETVGGWQMLATHLYVDFTPPSWPPPWASFPRYHDPNGATYDSYTVPLSELSAGCDDTLYISAHTSLIGDVDGWSEPDPSDGWTKYFSVTIRCEYIPGEPMCETAWGDGPMFPGRNWATYFTYTVQ